LPRYGEPFKATAVKLSSLPGVLIQDVAAALDIHPFMLSLWRKQVRDGVIVAKGAKLDVQTTAELKRLKELERQYKVLKDGVLPNLRGPGFLVHYEGESAAGLRGPGFLVHYEGESAAVAITR
jgi:hypothetical protein